MQDHTPPGPVDQVDRAIREARRAHPQATPLDAAYLRPREVVELRRMVEGNASETELDHFIRGEPNLLSSLLHFAGTGHHGGMVYPQQTIRPCVAGSQPGLVPDYLISGENSDGVSWWVLELKGPSEKLFAGSGRSLRLSDVANKALVQIHQYIGFCIEHQGALRDALRLREFGSPLGILVIGREHELSDPERRRLKRTLGGPSATIRIRTWDSLLRSLEHKLCLSGLHEGDPLLGEQAEEWDGAGEA
jgi:hypothetical protein